MGQNSSSPLNSFASWLLLESLPLLASFIASKCLIYLIFSANYFVRFSWNYSIFSIYGLLLYLEKNFFISLYCYFLTFSITFFNLEVIYFLYSYFDIVYDVIHECLYSYYSVIRSFGLGLRSFYIKSMLYFIFIPLNYDVGLHFPANISQNIDLSFPANLL